MNRMIRMTLILFSIFIIAGCGEASQEDVIEDLEENLTELESYQTKATMEMFTGETTQKYQIDLAYQMDNYYRVFMHNQEDEEGSQIILKNDEGVFVLTPALNKSFRFQSDWPANASQPYLYHSLVSDILNDEEAEFAVMDEYYVFTTKTNYHQNQTLPTQEIYFHQKTLTPYLVKIYDPDHNVIVEVTFEPFELDVEFEDEFFEVDANLTSSIFSLPVSSLEEQATQTELSIQYPKETFASELVDTSEFDLEDGSRVVLTYQGEHDFTIVQEVKTTEMVAFRQPELSIGSPVHIGTTVGAITEHSLSWSENGIDYYLASESLTEDEMIQVAQSLAVEIEK
ncbi:outer membrane lipoprotein carrier protein LolA [Amphibacillus sp. MSJ-3]|uniref:LolA family protein n=1 Tax=Amphibacillus sp. MSJ-3 TaxID=2841505 RepID=UPI001C0EBB9B|nr:outer membrane lipoprotein carrier protein LolA [Amphibacillus sp. MSJ-3]MBU5595741.1 outer membrane lipoprotein carrier protein LolA [Amphibacillus sp. MSJ-3]